MAQQLNARPVNYIVLIAVVDQPRTLTQLRVEQRDFQYRLVSKALFSPMTDGGDELAFGRSLDLYRTLVSDALAADPSALGSQDRLNG